MPEFVISDDGYDSSIGMMTLQLLGLRGARSLEGGLTAWTSAQGAP